MGGSVTMTGPADLPWPGITGGWCSAGTGSLSLSLNYPQTSVPRQCCPGLHTASGPHLHTSDPSPRGLH